MIIHMLPGTGKTWLAKHYPATYADGDELYERAFPGRWKGRVHLLSITERYKALENFKIVLTNDHQIADISVLHSNLQQYLDMASKRPDLKPALITSWYEDAVLKGKWKSDVVLVDDPQDYVMTFADQYFGPSGLAR